MALDFNIRFSGKLAWMMLFPIFLGGCIEPFEPETRVFESFLVVEATLTDEVRPQQLRLSRTYPLEDSEADPVINAAVTVTDDLGTIYNFAMAEPGLYISETAFGAAIGRSYQLLLTAEGNNYASTPVSLTQPASIDALYAERATDDDGRTGVAIRVDASGGSSGNFRFEYEETYKIIAPTWSPLTLVPDPESNCGMLKAEREEENRVCFATDRSNSIILGNSTDLAQDRLTGFTVRFISQENYILSHRYSILVKQYAQTPEAFSYYETLQSLSGNESLFSEIQPGFLAGNINSEGTGESVLGYFEVAAVTERRIFFNYEDLFPGEPLPPYAEPCTLNAVPIVNMAIPPSCVLRPLVELDLVSYVKDNEGEQEGGPFLTAPFACGDCTALGETEIPEFWTED